ncbi:trans-1,2-dihydrobenzene-1,2-diol dehydrogenase-like isoform X2 [Phymastichus coffea]|uniref:trans-1,2-dihydrobenzene-1,2-diol dehydrogenase-like isoform X2 n=1 Tax=Phymastichus coffea TaxID=108790 RepID=UPI00273BDECC|nr:trans-1,2-dihydrobenzene-1,2-diol dehydrogenase-like isoform X2 [Phymastichus coffea]
MATRWGIASAGKISHDFATALATLPASEHRLVAVAARELDRAKDFAGTHGAARAYASYRELADDEEVEIVYVGALNPFHLEVGKMMLNAGKHVLCEKPLAMNLEQCRELIELARARKLLLMEAIWSRCFPAYESLRAELAKRSIGEVKQVIASFGFRLADVDRLGAKRLGGGTVLDLGVYVIQFVCTVFGHERPTEIKAVGHLNAEGVDASMSASLTYANGRTATVVTHAECELPNDAHVIGTHGSIRLPQFWCPTRIELPGGSVEEVPLPAPRHKLNFVNSTGLRYEAMEARECIRRGLLESPKVTHAHSLLIAEIEDELRRQLGVVYDVD